MGSSHQLSPSSSQPPSPDLAAIAAMLANAAQVLLTAGKPQEAEEKSEQQTERDEEVRCYRFPALAVQCEQELFQEQGVENLQEVLYNASSSLKAFGVLLDRIDPEAHLEGLTLHMLAQELKRVGHVLFKIQDAYSTVERVEA